MVPNQAFPKAGMLVTNMDRDLTALRAILRDQDGPVYCYVEASIRYEGRGFAQTGSGPNFQGDVLTLCTCKHMMRSSVYMNDWPGTWVAGFTSRGIIRGEGNYLAYLMKVAEVHASHQDLWRALPFETREAKATDLHELGDVFRPRASIGDPFDPHSYYPPRPDHSHCNGKDEWRHDIDCEYYGRHPPLLVGDKRFSFLWSQPLIALEPPPLTRNYEKNRFIGINGLLNHLRG